MIQLLVCVQCTVQLDCYWCVYSAQCSENVIGMCTVHRVVRLLLVCVQCTVQNESVIGVCTVHSVVRRLLVCVQCTVQ